MPSFAKSHQIMQFSIPLLVFLSLSRVCLGFTIPGFAGNARIQPLNGFIGDTLGDEKKDDIDNGVNALADRATKPTLSGVSETGAKLTTSARPAADTAEEEDEGLEKGTIKVLPTKAMTGVDPAMTRLCATVSREIYRDHTIDDFFLSTEDMKCEILLYDNHGIFDATSPAFVAVVTGKTMILGWRGSQKIMDFLADGFCAPASSIAWRKYSSSIKAFGSMISIVQNDMVAHEKKIIEAIGSRGIEEIITTGHSLGGGLSQSAHLYIRAQIEDVSSPWSELDGKVEIRSMNFEPPMTTVLIDNDDEDADEFVEKLSDNSCTFVFSQDIVPRLPAYLAFVYDFVDNAVDNAVGKGLDKVLPVKLPLAGRLIVDQIFDFKEKVETLAEGEGISELIQVLIQFRHVGNVIYYKDYHAKPLVLRDLGAHHEAKASEKNRFFNLFKKKSRFRDITYKRVKNPISQFYPTWHMAIVRGPGLSYPKEDGLPSPPV